MRGINYDILNQDKAREDGKELANKHLNMVKDVLKEVKNSNPDERKIYKLSVKEFKDLMVGCFEMLKQRDLDTSMEEYKRLTDKRGEAFQCQDKAKTDVFIRNGVPVPKE